MSSDLDSGGSSRLPWPEDDSGTIADRPPAGFRRRRSPAALMALLCLLLLVVAAAIFLALHYLPLREEADRLRAGAAEVDARVAAAEAETEQLRQRLSALGAERDELTAQRDALRQTAAETRSTIEALERQFQVEIESGDILVRTAGGEVSVDLASRILFASGSSELTRRGKALLRRMADTLRSLEDRVIHVAGHTDSVQISPALQEHFPTNWELSTARATNVVRYLQDECEIPGDRLAATGYAQYRPVASNRSRRGRQLNRRIEIKLSARPAPEAQR